MNFHLKRFFTIIFAFILMMNANIVFGNETAHKDSVKAEKESFNIKEMIFDHVLDAYSWHLLTVGEHHYSIPLPIIVKSEDKGWNVFLSSKIAHGHEYKGFYLSKEEKNKGKVVEKNVHGEEVRPLNLSLTKNAFSILLSSTLLIVILLYIASLYKKNPLRSMKGFSGAMEQLIVSINEDVIKPGVGKDYKRYSPYLLTVFFFIFVNNLLGLIPVFPGGANITGNIAVTMILAALTFLITNFSGNKEYWKEIFWPDVPVFLKTPLFPLMQFIEIIGIITKPFALMIRLFANMLAGHMVILVFMGLIFVFAGIMGMGAALGVSVLSVTFSIFMLLLDVLVSFIQAYVFTMLSSLFIGLAQPEHHHEEKAH